MRRSPDFCSIAPSSVTVPAGRASGRRALVGKAKFTSRVHIRRDASAALAARGRSELSLIGDCVELRAPAVSSHPSACPAVAFTGAVAERCSSILIPRPSAARTRKLDRTPKPFSPHVSLEKCPLASPAIRSAASGKPCWIGLESSRRSAQSAGLKLPGTDCSTVTRTSFGISRAQTTKKVAG